MKYLVLVLCAALYLSASNAQAAACYVATGQSGYVSAIGFQNGTEADAIQKGKNMIRRACRQNEGSNMNHSTFRVDDTWSERRGTAVSTAVLWFADVYACCY